MLDGLDKESKVWVCLPTRLGNNVNVDHGFAVTVVIRSQSNVFANSFESIRNM